MTPIIDALVTAVGAACLVMIVVAIPVVAIAATAFTGYWPVGIVVAAAYPLMLFSGAEPCDLGDHA